MRRAAVTSRVTGRVTLPASTMPTTIASSIAIALMRRSGARTWRKAARTSYIERATTRNGLPGRMASGVASAR